MQQASALCAQDVDSSRAGAGRLGRVGCAFPESSRCHLSSRTVNEASSPARGLPVGAGRRTRQLRH